MCPWRVRPAPQALPAWSGFVLTSCRAPMPQCHWSGRCWGRPRVLQGVPALIYAFVDLQSPEEGGHRQHCLSHPFAHPNHTLGLLVAAKPIRSNQKMIKKNSPEVKYQGINSSNIPRDNNAINLGQSKVNSLILSLTDLFCLLFNSNDFRYCRVLKNAYFINLAIRENSIINFKNKFFKYSSRFTCHCHCHFVKIVHIFYFTI